MVYFILKILEILIFFIFGKKISKAKSNIQYWKLSIIPILTYSIVEGLRFGRFIDWNLYYFRYKQLGENVSSLDYEFLFRYICHFLYQINVPYYGFIFFQCMFFIICVMILIKNFKAESKWILPLVLVSSTANEMFIRWFLAFSFILLVLNSILNKKYIQTTIWTILGILCHSGIIVIVSIITLLFVLKKYTIPSKISFIMLCFSTFVLSLSDMMFITKITSLIMPYIGENYEMGKYIENTSELLSGEWGGVGIMERSLLKTIILFLAYSPVILWGREYIIKYQNGSIFYNLFVIGAVGTPLFAIEIFDRIFCVCLFFFCIVGGIFYTNIFSNKINNKRFILKLSIMSLLFAISPHISDAIKREADIALFIWDANGRNYIPF